MTADTLVHRIARWASATPDNPATHVKTASGWQTQSWAQHWQAIRNAAGGLHALGVSQGECVAILAGNRPEWVQAQFGTQALGGIVAPIYTTSTVAQTGYIVKNSGARIALCDSRAQLDKLLAAEAEDHCASLTAIVTFDALEHPDPRVTSYASLLARGAQAEAQGAVDARMASLHAEDTCMLIYTSGTTGTPKGVMLTHAGQLATIGAVFEEFSIFKQAPYRIVSYLPLSHQTEQIVTNIGCILTGGQAYFCPEVTQVREYLTVARPTLFMGVPRVWEKFEAALRARLSETSGLKGKLASWALATELQGFERDCESGRYHGSLSRTLARKLVIDKIKAQLGLDQLLVAFTGSAPMSESTMRFFGSLGITVHEGYGLSETSGLATTHRYNRPRRGTVGRALSCCELRIASDGEIEVRGPNLTRGYLGLPNESAELFTEDGFLRTGDLGQLDADGELRITGRKKEILITAGGKNVAPVEMENLIRTIAGVGQVVVVGDREPYLSALITLEPERLATLAASAGVPENTLPVLASHPRVHDYLQAEVERACNAKVARYQTIKRIAVLPVEFSVEGGELTASMKLRRKEICAKYADVIASLYADKNAHAAE